MDRLRGGGGGELFGRFGKNILQPPKQRKKSSFIASSEEKKKSCMHGAAKEKILTNH